MRVHTQIQAKAILNTRDGTGERESESLMFGQHCGGGVQRRNTRGHERQPAHMLSCVRAAVNQGRGGLRRACRRTPPHVARKVGTRGKRGTRGAKGGIQGTARSPLPPLLRRQTRLDVASYGSILSHEHTHSHKAHTHRPPPQAYTVPPHVAGRGDTEDSGSEGRGGSGKRWRRVCVCVCVPSTFKAHHGGGGGRSWMRAA